MPSDTPGQRNMPALENPVAWLERMMVQAVESPCETAMVKKAGRPKRLSNRLVASGILWCVLHGWVSQWDLWRRVSCFGMGSLAPVAVCDQAIYNRLAKHATAVMQELCAQSSSWLWQWMAPSEDRQLAPFATRIYALDESTMRPIKRWLEQVRDGPIGDPSLLAGRLSGLFDIRRQQWVRIDWLPKAIANCQVHAEAMLSQIEIGALLLFDLGYSNFEWFETLTPRGIWWVARLRSHGSSTIEPILVQRDGSFEALIFLGASRWDQAAHLMRLIRVRYRGQWYSYIPTITDPCQLSGAQIVALSARRWDIELGFRMLKDHLGLRFLWSAKMQVIGAQLWATVILAQILHALQVQVAIESGGETFDVSLEVLWRYLPALSQLWATQGHPLLEVIKEVGVALKLIRPSTRIGRVVPDIDWQELSPLPIDLIWIREPHYAHKTNTTRSRTSKKTQKEPGVI
jgi:hypothetical protein